MSVDIVYHTRYRGNRTQGYVAWELDTSRLNDIAYGRGRYDVVKVLGRGGGTRLFYVFEATSKRSVGRQLLSDKRFRSVRDGCRRWLRPRWRPGTPGRVGDWRGA